MPCRGLSFRRDADSGQLSGVGRVVIEAPGVTPRHMGYRETREQVGTVWRSGDRERGGSGSEGHSRACLADALGNVTDRPAGYPVASSDHLHANL